METIYRQREDSQNLNGTSWARQVVHFFWKFFEMTWKQRNDSKFKNDSGEKEKEQITNLIADIKVRTRFIPEKFQKFVKKGEALLTAKKINIGKMKSWINLMTDQRTVADIRKEHHDRYGTDIKTFLIRPTDTYSDHHSEQPIRKCEPENDHEDINSLRKETYTRNPDSIV